MENSKVVSLIDFDDSFTLNIASELSRLKIKVNVLNIKDCVDSNGDFLDKVRDTSNLILGPGPGNPNDYAKRFNLNSLFDHFFNEANKSVIGICLGHQLIGIHLGFSIQPSKIKKHGENVKYLVQQSDPCFPKELFNREIGVQRYNSLVLKEDKTSINSDIFIGKDEHNEIACLKTGNFLSYQFHPESVGTKYRSHIFLYLTNFLYN